MKNRGNKILLLLLLISVLLTSTVYAAASGSVVITPEEVVAGDTVTVTLYLSDLGQVTSLGLTYTVPEELEFLNAKWELQGATLKNVDTTAKQAVIAFDEPITINRKTALFTVTYKVPQKGGSSDDSFRESTVTFTVKYKLHASDLGSVTVTEKLTVCDHSRQEVRGEKAATCVAEGYSGDTYCGSCNKKIKEGTIIPATGKHTGGTATCAAQAVCALCRQPYGDKVAHVFSEQWSQDGQYHWNNCINCKDAIDNRETHRFAWVTDRQPSETETGLKHEACSVCGFRRNENTEIPVKQHEHTGVRYYPAVAATCTTEGNVEYWTCSSGVCSGKYYGDSACQRELSGINTPVDPDNHTGKNQIRNQKEATCGAPGYSGDTVCTSCGKVVGKGTEIPATGYHTAGEVWQMNDTDHWRLCTQCKTAKMDSGVHTFQWVTDKRPTEESAGLKHEQCTVCGKTRNENTTIEKLEHTHTAIVHHEAVAATCVRQGNVEYWTCGHQSCDGIYYGDENCASVLSNVKLSTDPKNHVSTEVRNQREATCGTEGYTGDTVCTQCNTIVSRGSQILPTGEHTPGTAWYFDENNHWHQCQNSGCGQRTDTQAHTFTWVLDKASTETSTGLKHEACSCGAKRNENTQIPVQTHKHTDITHHKASPATCVKAGTVEYWTCGASLCAGKYYGDSACQVELDTIVEPVNSTNHTGDTAVKNAKEATCAASGYSGDICCKDCGGVVKKGTVIGATGKHTPQKSLKKDDSHHWSCCGVCGATIESTKQAHTYTWVTDQAPTEKAEGLRHQECTVCGQRGIENDVVNKLPHRLEFVEAKPASCTENGVIEHFACKGCGKYYASENGKTGAEISGNSVVIPAEGHTYFEQWHFDEKSHWHLCVCGEAGDQSAHQSRIVDAREATETTAGYTGDAICSVCGYLVEKGEVIPAGKEPTQAPVPEQEDEPQSPTEIQNQTEPKENKTMIPAVIVVVAAAGALVSVMIVKKKKDKKAEA